MDFKEIVITFFSILALLRGAIVWPSRTRFGRGPLTEDPWCRVTAKDVNPISKQAQGKMRWYLFSQASTPNPPANGLSLSLDRETYSCAKVFYDGAS